MKSDLETVLDRYDHDCLRVTVSHDGFRIEDTCDEGNPIIWSWDPAHDREPFEALETLFERQGFDVEQL